MATLIVYRNSYQQSKRWEEIIMRVWNQNDIMYRIWYGCNTLSAESIVNSFEIIHRVYQKGSLIKVHCCSIVFDYLTNKEDVKAVMMDIMNWFSPSFQIIGVMTKRKDGKYEATFIINAVSYRNGHMFHDNNTSYIHLKTYLEDLFQTKMSFCLSDQTLFSDDSHVGNYTNII